MDDWKTNQIMAKSPDRLWNVDTSFAVCWTPLIAYQETKAMSPMTNEEPVDDESMIGLHTRNLT